METVACPGCGITAIPFGHNVLVCRAEKAEAKVRELELQICEKEKLITMKNQQVGEGLMRIGELERLYSEVLDLLDAHGNFVCYYRLPTQPPNRCGTCADCKLDDIRNKSLKRNHVHDWARKATGGSGPLYWCAVEGCNATKNSE